MHVPMCCSSVSVCLGFTGNEGKMVMRFRLKQLFKKKKKECWLCSLFVSFQGDKGETGLKGEKVVFDCYPSKTYAIRNKLQMLYALLSFTNVSVGRCGSSWTINRDEGEYRQ